MSPGTTLSLSEHPHTARPSRARRLAAAIFSVALALILGPARAPAQLPPGWSDGDIGSPAFPGSATYSSGTWTVAGGGAEVCNADQFHFVWQTLTGDSFVVAQLASLQNAPSAEGGLMLRNDLTPGSMYAAVLSTAANGVRFEWRDTTGLWCYYQIAIAPVTLGTPIWLKLQRTGTAFSAFWSTNTTDWYQVGSTQTVPLNQQTLGGLVVTANDNTALCTATFTGVSGPPPVFGAYRQLWTGLNPALGNTLAALTNSANNPGWPNNPNPAYTHVFTALETETNSGLTYYGQRVRAFVIPPLTGNYTFWISSHNTSQLFLSPNENAAQENLLAWVNTATAPRQWNLEPNQQSGPVPLQAGHRYYLEALMQQSTGTNDNLAVKWLLPNGVTEEPLTAGSLAGTLLVPCRGVDDPPGISLQPTNILIQDGKNGLFAVLSTNQGPVAYQWHINGTNSLDPSASSPVYLINRANPYTQNNLTFACVVSNASGVVTSTPALLTVPADLTPPIVSRALYLNPTNVQIIFSEPVAASGATNPANYVFTNGLPLAGVTLSPDSTSVTLTTAPLVQGSNYVIVLNNIYDLATVPNRIAANTLVYLFASPYYSQGVGSPTPAGTISGATGGSFDIGGGGRDIGGTSDSFQFAYVVRTGDFDLRTRLAAFTQTDPYAKAGLMAREDLTAGSRFAAVFATPSLSGSFFEARTAIGASAMSSGLLPVNYPQTWLRLRRAGDQFTGYASYDGSTWQQLGTATIVITNPLYFGMAVCSHNPNVRAIAQFRDLSDVSNAVTGPVTIPHEPPGPCSRLTPIAITEIMYKPAPRADTNNVEFIELYNSNPYYEDISGFQIAGGSISYTFPPGSTIRGGAFLVVAASPASISSVYGIANVTGPYTGSLKKAGTIQLLDDQGAILLTVPYSNVAPWPAGALGTGHSIVLANPSYGEADPRAWANSDSPGGSPGAMDGFTPGPLRSVLINEFLAHSENPAVPQFIELYNHSTQSNDLSGCILTDDPATNKFTIPAGTSIAPAGFVSFNQSQLGFSLLGSGDTLFLLSPDGSRILDCVQFDAQADGVSFGRWPDGANDFYPLAARTPGAPNSSILIRDIVINELMYDPISGNDDDQFIELYNKGTNTLSLANWQLISGVSFTFPPNVSLAPDHYLVVGRNIANLFAKYPNLNATNTVGDWGGKLSHKGERVALAMPQSLISSNILGRVTNTIFVVEDEVTYAAGGRWGQWAHGGGSSLELLNPNTNHRLAYNWADSDETAKSVWTNLEFTGTLDNGNNYGGSPVNRVQIGLLDIGECLVDNIEVLPGGIGGPNIVSDGDFESGLAGWLLMGDHMRSSLETVSGLGGYQSPQSLHLRSSDSVWTLGDYAQGTLTQTSLGPGQTATLRLKARWLHGWPEILMRLRGNWLEVTGAMPVPPNLGTPGQRNSRFLSNPAPAIYEVKHSPPLPPANQPFIVTARFHDANTFQPTLLYRIDRGVVPVPTYTPVPMVDNGTGGDAVAGDGIYTATIPAQPGSTVVAFLVQARDSLGATNLFPADLKNNAGLPRECVVAFGDPIPTGNFGHHHVFITQNWANRWAQNGGVSHELYDGTWVDGSSGRIVYNWLGRYAGSPYHQYLGSPVTTVGGMHWIMPDDDQVFGTTSFNKQHVPGNGPLDDNTIQREQTCFWMAHQIGLGRQNRRYYVSYVNGNRHGPLMEDAQVPGAEMLKEYWPNDNNGWLFKNHTWFEGDVAQQANGYMNFQNMSWCYLIPFTTSINGGPSQYKLARYRWMWWIRQFPTSANDFSQVYALIDAANTPTGSPAYYQNMEAQVDTEQWLRMSAMEHASGDWDSFFTQNQWNMYTYKPTMGKWTVLKWDWNISLGGGTGTWPPDGSQLFTFNPYDYVMATFQTYPAYQRAYLRALQDIANLGMNNSAVNSVLDAKYAAFVANGLTTTAYGGLTVTDPGIPGGLKSWIGTMHNSIVLALANQGVSNVPFAVNSVVVNNNVAIISGTAPLVAKTLWFNGVPYPVTWNSTTAWTVTVPLQPGSNQLTVTGVDLHGNPVPGLTTSVTAVSTTPALSPVGQVVINEILSNPSVPGGDFIELYNNSSTTTFDLSGWQLRDVPYTFPAGSLIAPNSFLLLGDNRSAFASQYGGSIPLFDAFNSPLSPAGQTLFLVDPGTNAASDLLVAAVRYAGAPPWPSNAPGSSLQLIDSTRDNWRAGNWALSTTNGSGTPPPQWQYVTLTGTAPRPTLLICMHNTAGDVYIDDLKLVAGSVPEAGPNLLVNGDFESPLTGPWTVSPNMASSVISSAFAHSGNSSLHVIATSPGDTVGASIWENTAPIVTNGTYTLSYWYLPSTNGSQLLIRLSGSSPGAGQIYSLQNIAPPPPVILADATPGSPNSVAASLPAFPPLWINEIQADNLTGITNSAGQHAPWIELFNPTTNVVSLSGLFLANNYTNLTPWAFPAGASINPGQFKVIFADGQSSLSTLAELHTSFRLSSGSGSLALSRLNNGTPQVLDYIDYTNIAPNNSFGSYPDGQSFFRQEFFYASPGSLNNGTIPASFIAYNSAGQVYSQNFDALPNPGLTSVNTANPVTINGVTYSLANPFDFGFPVSSSGNNGGLGLPSLNGWYGLGALASKFGATDGDQTTGGVLSFGLPNSGNRALGLLATSSTGGTAFGAKFINQTTNTFNSIDLHVTGEVWRQSNLPKTLQCFYYIDPTATASFPLTATGFLPGLNVNIPTVPSAVGGIAVDGTSPLNQTNLGIVSQIIGNWPPGAALWLVWQMTDNTGRAQGLAIDNLSFSASVQIPLIPVPLTIHTSSTNLVMSWPSYPGQMYQVEYKDDLSVPAWTPSGAPIPGTGATITVTITNFTAAQRFYHLVVLPN